MRFGFVKSIIALAVFSQSPAANAETIRMHQCERAGVTRTVDLQADNDSGVPCRVLYHRPMEDQSTANLWNARNDAQFCVGKYDAFIVKLENKLNWSCELVESFDPPLAQEETHAEYPGIGDLDPGVKETDSTDAATDSNDIVVESVAAITPKESPIINLRPKIARALPIDEIRQNADSALSMKLIKQYIPSGNYVSYKGQSHSGNSSICPADGFFIWNTKSPDKPVFEMGITHQFQFDLASTSDRPVASVLRSVKFEQCQPQISAGYCLNEKYIGKSPLHPALTSYFGCDGKSENLQRRWPLVLVREITDSNSSDPECTVSGNHEYLALASSLQSSEPAEIIGKHDIELLILPKPANSESLQSNNGSICRYARGG